MAIVKFAVVKGREICGSLDYITQDDKTLAELKTGINCQVESAGDEMLAIQKAYGKTDGRRLVHIIQSFHPKDPVTLEQAHKIGLEFAALWPDYQIVLATHRDTDHIHNHFVMNSVRMSDGKKFHQSNKELEQVKIFSNKLCAENGLKVCPLKNPNNTSAISKKEYQVAIKGNSWKMQLLNVIDNAMKKSRNREEFIRNIKAQGYDVRWQDNYKYLTYYCPNNKKCRDIKLHDIRYLKERMEREFEIRRAQTLEFARECIGEVSFAGDDTGATAPISADDRGTIITDTGYVFTDREKFTADKQQALQLRAATDTADTSRFTAAESGDSGNQDDTSSTTTGWETERQIFFSGMAENAERGSATELGMATSPDVAGSLVGAVIKVGRAVERAETPVPMTPTPSEHIDSKRYKKLAEKKQAQGQKMSSGDDEPMQIQTM